MSVANKPEIHSFFDETTNAACYVVKDASSNSCAIVDSILDFDVSSGTIETTHADGLIEFITKNTWDVEWIIETHVHADHLSGAPYLAQKLGGKIAIGANIDEVQKEFGKIFNAGTEFEMDGSQFDHLFKDGDVFHIGNLQVTVLHTPGHTPACVTYLMGDAAIIGDTMFMPDFGTARADFPGGSARKLYNSIQKSYHYLIIRGCFSATITKRLVAMNIAGKPQLRNKRQITSMLEGVGPRMNL